MFAVAGVAVVDDYGISRDEVIHRGIALAVADDAWGLSEPVRPLLAPPHAQNLYYGVAFDLPLALAARALGFQDTRRMYLTRHLIMHLFFIAGGFVCALLAYRMLGSRWIALMAMLTFLLHPRLYAHSFINTKDTPFAVMLLIALYLAHRAFRKDTIGAFLLCGIAAGLAINLRPFALLLLPIIPAMRAPDLWQAGKIERKRVLMTGAAFLSAALATMYITHPYYWENPLRFVEGIRVFSQHPSIVDNLFMGEIYPSDAVPWNYIPVWFAITAPPLTLLTGAIGCAAVCWQGATRPIAALRDREIRFRILLLGCFALPVVVVIALESNIYRDWRHMYFLWAPFCLLAAVGLHALVNANAGKDRWKLVAARMPGWVRGGRLHMARRALAYGVLGFGLITTLTAMAALHPYEHIYFNALTDTKTPGALSERYDMDYWQMSHRQAAEYLLARYPDDVLRVWPSSFDMVQILPQKDRDRIVFTPLHAADFYLVHYERIHEIRQMGRDTSLQIHPRVNFLNILNQPPIHSVRLYGNLIISLVPKDIDAYRAAYDDIAANGDLLARSAFDIYAYDGAIYYLSADCAPPAPNTSDSWMFLHIFPADPADLLASSREVGFENADFRLDKLSAFFDGKCIHKQALPDYPIARIRTGQSAATSGGAEWRVDVNLSARAAAQAIYDGIAAGDYGQPVAQSDFDVYLRGDGLTYLKENCAADDADARFFLHIFPADPADLPADRREHGFANLDFQFAERGAYAGDNCVAERELPDYAIERIRTGQFVSGEGQLWGVEFPAAR